MLEEQRILEKIKLKQIQIFGDQDLKQNPLSYEIEGDKFL